MIINRWRRWHDRTVAVAEEPGPTSPERLRPTIVDDAKSGGGDPAAASEFSLRDPELPLTVGAGATAERP
jgi:hypothetical protein